MARSLATSAISLLLCVLVPLSAFGDDNGYKVDYDGGSIQGLKAGNDIRLVIEAAEIRLLKGKNEVARIPASAVTEISYGQDVHRRIGSAIGLAVVSFGIGGLMALTKSKKHFIGVTWDGDGSKGGFAFQADKNNYRGILTGLEGVTGKKSVNTDTLSVKN